MIENTGAGEGNRTLVISLEGCCSTIELHPQITNGGSPGSRRSLAHSLAQAVTLANEVKLRRNA